MIKSLKGACGVDFSGAVGAYVYIGHHILCRQGGITKPTAGATSLGKQVMRSLRCKSCRLIDALAVGAKAEMFTILILQARYTHRAATHRAN